MINSEKQKSILITGAGSGIGAATARYFLQKTTVATDADSRWHVILVGRRLESLKHVGKPFQSGIWTSLACDLTSAEDVKNLSAHLSRQFPLTALVNNAGIYDQATLQNTSDEIWRRQFETNVLAPARLTRELLNASAFDTKTPASIVNVASTLGLRSVAGTSAYSAAKAAMISWTKTLALEMADKNIRVNCVCPGIVETPIHSFFGKSDATSEQTRSLMNASQPLKRMGQPEEIAKSISYFVERGSEWTTGSVLSVDGGIGL